MLVLWAMGASRPPAKAERQDAPNPAERGPWISSNLGAEEVLALKSLCWAMASASSCILVGASVPDGCKLSEANHRAQQRVFLVGTMRFA